MPPGPSHPSLVRPDASVPCVDEDPTAVMAGDGHTEVAVPPGDRAEPASEAGLLLRPFVSRKIGHL